MPGGLSIGGPSQDFVLAELHRFIDTEEWIAEEKRWRYPILTLHYTLEIELPYVAADELEFDPDVRIALKDFPSPSLETLVGRRLDELGVVEAWAGHDGGELMGVRLTLDSLTGPDRADVTLSGHFTHPEEGPTRVAFSGPVALSPIETRVKDPADADVFFALVHGADVLRRASRTDGEWRIHDEGFSEDRRRWLPVSYRLEATGPSRDPEVSSQ